MINSTITRPSSLTSADPDASAGDENQAGARGVKNARRVER
jgi:hypothetical protein